MSTLDAQNLDVGREVEKFYYREARLIDDKQFDDWLDMWAEDARVWAPVRYNRTRREQHLEESKEGEVGYFDDDKAFLRVRVSRLASGMAWAEDPPSRTRHLITNVEVEADETGTGDYTARSHFLVHRSRLEHEVDLFSGARHDILRRVDGGLQIARRKIVLDANVLLAKNLSIFF